MNRLYYLCIAFLIAAQSAIALVCSPASSPGNKAGRYVVTASDWNTAIPGVYTYINTNIVTPLNLLTTKGAFYVYDGTALRSLVVGSNNQVLQADSSQANGMKWATYTGAAPLTTKGDLAVTDGNTITRLPIGANDYALVARSTAAYGVAWESLASAGTTYPKGACVPWSPAGAGTSTIPTGYVLCDGSNSTPNMIGLFCLGTRQNGSSSGPAAGGYGAQMPDAAGSGTYGHTQYASYSGFTVDADTTGNPLCDPGPPSGSAATLPHTHTIAAGGVTTNTASLELSDYALVYIMKQ